VHEHVFQAALRDDLVLVAAAKKACVESVDLAFAALKDQPPMGAKVEAAVAALEAATRLYGPIGAETLEKLTAAKAAIAKENAGMELLRAALTAGQLSEPVDDIKPEAIDTGPLKLAIGQVVRMAEELAATVGRGRVVAEASALLQPENQVQNIAQCVRGVSCARRVLRDRGGILTHRTV